ncbi:unnamed protein product [Ilex paraguariensis]|uniref:Uncharacterized protein n=1 Tax=Ilex paraguariensis TaxID=185542 RepID=A0ABC8RG04_9AQUA
MPKEPSQALQDENVAADISSDCNSIKESPNEAQVCKPSSSTDIHVSEEQKARIEANRLKALERAAARARSLQAA